MDYKGSGLLESDYIKGGGLIGGSSGGAFQAHTSKKVFLEKQYF